MSRLRLHIGPITLALSFGLANLACAGQTPIADSAPVLPTQSLPDQPLPNPPQASEPLARCLLKRTMVGTAWAAAQAAASGEGEKAATGAMAGNSKPLAQSPQYIDAALVPCNAVEHILSDLQAVKNLSAINWYARFLNGPTVKPMTPKEKAWLAVRNVADPFNALTIMASSAIAVGANSHSAYGPGFTGWGRDVGVSYTEDITGEFFGTFLIPSLVHQDPHYHRMPEAGMKRRIAHVLYQIAWTQGDDGKGMVNYADLLGFGIDDEIGNLYVPGQQTNARATAERYGTALATAPIDNAITEFLPDIARKIHVRVVLIQHIINQVANKEATNSAP